MKNNGIREGKIDELKPDRRNANKGTQAGLRALDKSLRELGAGRSILVDKKGEIIAGNKTTERAADIGIEDIIFVPTDGKKLVAVQRTDLDLETDEEARLLAYADNRIAEIDLEWDYEQVDFDLDQGVDLEWLGFEMEKEPEPDPGAQIDRAEELREKWGVESGQLWRLGDHRLICGDCTDAEVVGRVMEGERAIVAITDPPYGIDYDYKDYEDISGDEYERFCDVWFFDLMLNCGLLILTTGWKYKPYWYTKEPTGELMWFDKTKQSGHNLAHLRKSEPIFVFGKINDKYAWDTFENEGVRGDGVRELHTCPKPVSLFEDLIKPQTHQGDIVLDIFLGSGTTLIACERLGRKCRAVEISPAYCAVAIQRWADMTGGEPELIDED